MGQLLTNKIDFTKHGVRIEPGLSPLKKTHVKQAIKHKRDVQEVQILPQLKQLTQRSSIQTMIFNSFIIK